MSHRPVKISLHTTDASSGVVVTLFEEGKAPVPVELNSSDEIFVEELVLVSAAGGDCIVFFGPDASHGGDSETILRGTLGANGALASTAVRKSGKGNKLWIDCPAGVVDVFGSGYVISR